MYFMRTGVALKRAAPRRDEQSSPPRRPPEGERRDGSGPPLGAIDPYKVRLAVSTC